MSKSPKSSQSKLRPSSQKTVADETTDNEQLKGLLSEIARSMPRGQVAPTFEITPDDDDYPAYLQLMETAKAAARRTYSPYSNYPVGAAVLTTDGKVFSGCNVENASYGATICAERTALVKAVSEGHKQFKAIAVRCELSHESWPCGVCRQFICEFGTDIEVIVETEKGLLHCMAIGELLPRNFGPRDLT